MEYPLSYKRYLEQGRLLFTDSRQVIANGVFIALHGPNFNGNEYAIEALEKGAAYAIVDKVIVDHPRLILVKNTLEELQFMARLNRKINKAKIIAITGSNGKTTTKELCYSIFKLVHNTIATIGNLNNHIGVPLTLLAISEETEYAIVEMGANRKGDIAELCRIAEPDIGLITSIGKAHLEGFRSIEGVVAAKMELFDYLIQHQKICIYNMCSELIKTNYKESIGAFRFGENQQELDFSSELMRSFPDIEMKFRTKKEEVILHSKLFGEYNYQNILSAASLARFCEISMQNIQEGIANYIPGNMRSQILQKDNNTILLDAYNANPSSMKEVIEIFDKMQFDNKWIVLGEMAELGDHKVSEHRLLFDIVQSKNFAKKIFIGKTYQAFINSDEIIYFDDVLNCRNWLDVHWPQQTAILIKGSRSSHLEKLIH